MATGGGAHDTLVRQPTAEVVLMRGTGMDGGMTGVSAFGEAFIWDNEPPAKVRKWLGFIREAPWAAFLSTALYMLGMIIWILGATQVADQTVQFGSAISVEQGRLDFLRAAVSKAVTAIAVVGFITAALVLTLSVFRTVARTMLRGVPCCNKSEPEPVLFTTYQNLNLALNTVIWLLLLVSSGILLLTIIWLAGCMVARRTISSGTEAFQQQQGLGLDPVGLNFTAVTDASQGLQEVLKNATSNEALLESLLGDDLTPFQPFCPSVCLSIGSLARVVHSQSCICGRQSMEQLLDLADGCEKASSVALAGAVMLYLGSTALLVLLTAHYVHASYDLLAALDLQEQRQYEYESGYRADPKDCVAPSEGGLPMSRSNSMARGNSAPLPPGVIPTRSIPLVLNTGENISVPR